MADDERGNGASNSPKPAEDGTDPVPELTDLHSAFDSIDDTMKDVARKESPVTPEALAQIVNEAVAKAISEYEQLRGITAGPAETSQDGAAPQHARGVAPRDPSKPKALPQTPWRDTLEQLQGDMGLSDIEFDGPPVEPAETIIHRQLSKQMGVHDFKFDETPAVAGEPAAPTRTEANAAAGWKTPPHDAAPSAPPDAEQTRAPAPVPVEQLRAPVAVPDVAPLRAPAPAEPNADDPEEEFSWITAALEAGGARIEADPLPAPPVVEPPPARARGAAAPQINKPPVTPKPEFRKTVATPDVQKTVAKPDVRKTVSKPEAPETLNKPEVRETRRSLSSWFRAALADAPQARVPQPAATMPVREAKSPVVPVAAPAPPPVTAPPPVAARPDSKPEPAPHQNAAAKPVMPEEAAKDIRFTFDPILPVPPRLPREPKDPPKKG